jgi:Spy/CpxP family protein refolding chaperone
LRRLADSPGVLTYSEPGQRSARLASAEKENDTMRKHLTLFFATCLVVGAAVAYAQPWHHGGMGMHGIDKLATALDLDATQRTQVEQLRTTLMTQAKPLFDQHRQQMQEIHALLDAGNADAATIGQKMIAAHATRQQIKALHEDFATKVGALLDADQLTKFKALQSMRQQHMGMHGHGMMEPPAAGE